MWERKVAKGFLLILNFWLSQRYNSLAEWKPPFKNHRSTTAVGWNQEINWSLNDPNISEPFWSYTWHTSSGTTMIFYLCMNKDIVNILHEFEQGSQPHSPNKSAINSIKVHVIHKFKRICNWVIRPQGWFIEPFLNQHAPLHMHQHLLLNSMRHVYVHIICIYKYW